MKKKRSFRERLQRPWQYIKDRTGFFAYTDAEGKIHRGKTLWDLMQLLVIPVILAGGAIFFNQQAGQHEQQIAEDHNRETALQNYLDRMTELLVDKDLRKSNEESEVRSVARSRTLTTLRSLDGTRKGLLLRSLYESKLLDIENPIISLEDADLTGADLSRADLSAADLTGADLTEANLFWTDLTGSNLSEADLFRADLTVARLSGADLRGADLYGADLPEADLRGADLRGADLRMVDLSGADLTEAILTWACPSEDLTVADMGLADLYGTHLSGANLYGADLSGACLRGADLSEAHLYRARYNSQTKWPEGFDPDAAGATKT